MCSATEGDTSSVPNSLWGRSPALTTTGSHAIALILNLDLNLTVVLHLVRHPPSSSIPKQIITAAGPIVEGGRGAARPHEDLQEFFRQEVVNLVRLQQTPKNVVLSWQQH